jgi:hypothetical protein
MAIRRHSVRMRACPLRNKKRSLQLFLDSALLQKIAALAKYARWGKSNEFLGLESTELSELDAQDFAEFGIDLKPVSKVSAAIKRMPVPKPISKPADLPIGLIPRRSSPVSIPVSAMPVTAKLDVAEPAKRKPKTVRAVMCYNEPSPVARPLGYLIPRPVPTKSVTTTFSLDRAYVAARDMRVRAMDSRY